MMEVIAAHRRALAGSLGELTEAQWRGPSLCERWTPAHVLAHQTMPFRISGQEFMAGIERCGGDFTRFSDEVAARDSQLPPADLVRTLADNADNPWAPPGGGLSGALTHDVIHGLDITWPLGLAHEIPEAALITVLDGLTGPPPGASLPDVQESADGEQRSLFGFPLDGIAVLATDVGWSAGQGEELTGRARDLIPLLANRLVSLEVFGGAGAARARSLTGRP
ncbi:MAG TPA: maleylpyruvate isomerase family mycothiol-dependent enzyme [Streptosporangiaceae bacterium]